MMDYMKLDDRSIGMFWVVSYAMAQPACETVMNGLTSAGVTELLPGPNLQSNEKLMVMREVSPVPLSLLSGFSLNLSLKLAFLMEDSLFSGQSLQLLLNMLVDVFGKNSHPSTPVEASEIADLIDFLHRVVHYQGQGGPVQATSKPRPEVLALCA